MDVIHSGSKIFVAKIVSAVVSFVGIAYFSRELGAAQIGIFFLFQSVVRTVSIPANFGLVGAVEKRISEDNDSANILTTAALAKFGLVLILSLGMLAFRGQLNQYIGASVAIFLIGYLFLKEFKSFFLFVLKGELKIELAAYLRVASQISWIVLGSVFVLLGRGYIGLIYSIMIAAILTIAAGFYAKSTPIGLTPSSKQLQSLFDFSKYQFVSSIGGYSYSWIDLMIIGLFLESQFVGAYEIAWRVAAIVVLISESLSNVIFPQISHLTMENNTGEVEQIVSRVLLFAVLIPIPAFLGSLLLSQEVLVEIFGSEFGIAAVVLVILMFEKIPQSIDHILVHTLQGLDRPDLAAYPLLVATVLNITLNLLFVPAFGIVGAAVATTLAYLVNVVFHWKLVTDRLSIDVPVYEIGWVSVSGLVMFGLVFSLERVLQLQTQIELGILVSAGVVSYFLLVTYNNGIRSQFRRIIGW